MQTGQTTQAVALRDSSSDTQPLLLSVRQAASLLGIGATLAWELVRTGSIPTIKLGRRVLVPRAALEQLAQAGMSIPPQPHLILTTSTESRGGNRA